MVYVYFETSSTAVLVAKFINEEMYHACLPALEEQAKKDGFFITESIEENEEF